MTVEGRGVGMTAVDRMAACRNGLHMETFTNGIAKGERERRFSNPELAFSKFSSKAQLTLEALKGKMDKAEKLLDKAYERGESGEIDIRSLGAEVVSAKVVLLLSETLSSLFARAVQAKDIYALRVVAKAAEKLSVDADEILKTSVYPQDPLVKKTVIAQNIALARETYDVVVRSLDNTHSEHGVSLPEFPSSAAA